MMVTPSGARISEPSPVPRASGRAPRMAAQLVIRIGRRRVRAAAEIAPATIITSGAQLAWGSSSPWTAIKTGEGVLVDFDMKTKDDEVDDDGLVDVWLEELTPKVKITSPRGLTVKNLLDRMARETNTRYLIVTHNAVTMARMHRLFGVTMIEKGVSRLVSVDLCGAEELLAAE